ncbi:hypothetical protein AKJ16_DCAP00305 [Drosera capensis]
MVVSQKFNEESSSLTRHLSDCGAGPSDNGNLVEEEIPSIRSYVGRCLQGPDKKDQNKAMSSMTRKMKKERAIKALLHTQGERVAIACLKESRNQWFAAPTSPFTSFLMGHL